MDGTLLSGGTPGLAAVLLHVTYLHTHGLLPCIGSYFESSTSTTVYVGACTVRSWLCSYIEYALYFLGQKHLEGQCSLDIEYLALQLFLKAYHTKDIIVTPARNKNYALLTSITLASF